MGGRDYEAQLEAVINALAESVFDISDEEIGEEVREGGHDPDVYADGVRETLVGAVRAFKRRRLEKARRDHARRAAEVRESTREIPESPSARRKLLESLLSRKPHLRDALLTAQFRDYSQLPDEDVENLLRQLIYLGVLSQDSNNEG